MAWYFDCFIDGVEVDDIKFLLLNKVNGEQIRYSVLETAFDSTMSPTRADVSQPYRSDDGTTWTIKYSNYKGELWTETIDKAIVLRMGRVPKGKIRNKEEDRGPEPGTEDNTNFEEDRRDSAATVEDQQEMQMEQFRDDGPDYEKEISDLEGPELPAEEVEGGRP